MLTDFELMQNAAKGDMGAFGDLVIRHQQKAWNIAWRLLNDADEAEDVAQEAFIRILKAAPRYRPEAAFSTYLYRIVTRLCLDRLEKKRPDYMDFPPESISSEPDPSETLGKKETADSVRGMLNKLPSRQRTAIILRYYENLSYREISEVMNISEKSVEHLLARGREALGNFFDDKSIF